ncbi:hypothetical protein Rsub_02918 [Raphidocelis subcapitata]|uniref:Exportin-1 n=1 Tax=Raphidocelis subcapitata TaxID=307507 RepID=A0A2V0NQ25_9CHLO|nr:hypothetical protein Rsub_02918 [Raphidocelis subcapitata]|eukprot:GBF89748.1 hypothetical protein Rsub_02918 [Raphidocelis subcapitata]
MVEVAPALDITAVDVPQLEALVAQFYGAGTQEQRATAEKALKAYQDHPEAWSRVDTILEKAQTQQTKFFALQILESVIKFRWAALPMEQREGIKNYVSNLIIKYATSEQLFRAESVFMAKLNMVLVQILKQDWPDRWQSFLPDIVSASKTNETLCENSMAILKLLSEEVFDFSRGEMTQDKTRHLKQTLNAQFRMIHELCTFVLLNTRKESLVRATLTALHAYLSWVPVGYIFESNMVQLLLGLFPQAPFRNVSLQCLTEVACLTMDEGFDDRFQQFFKVFSQQLFQILPPGTNIEAAYASGTDEQQAFVQNLAIFFTSFLRAHLRAMEGTDENRSALLMGLDMLTSISYVDDVEVFKTCLDYWSLFVADVYSGANIPTTPGGGNQVPQPQAGTTLEEAARMQEQLTGPLSNGAGAFAFPPAPPPPGSAAAPADGAAAGAAPGRPLVNMQRRVLYGGVLQRLRALMVNRMAKPEEVIVVEDDNGNIVRETMKDNDVLAQYRTMRETLVMLSHLDYEDTELQMLEKLRLQMAGQWTWHGLNTLCWAIGSISGTMAEDQDNRGGFLVTVIRDLLNLCEVTRGKDNKAVIASNIMYVVGQYPKFLRAHWKFLKTVVNKLFEFMHETHPGVQDMACDTFLKISNKCKRKFVVQQLGESQPFISELLDQLPSTIQDLQPHQVHAFYEAVGLMVGAEGDERKRSEYLMRLMAPPNAIWAALMQQASALPDVLKQPDAIKSITHVLATNVSVCTSLGAPYLQQMQQIADSMLKLYSAYADFIAAEIAGGGPHAARSSGVKYMRGVKRSVLRLIEVFVDKCDGEAMEALLAGQYVPLLLDPLLGDYARSPPDVREAEVLGCFAAITHKLKSKMESHVVRVFESTFEPTLTMITGDFNSYPEHRLKFFALLHAITQHCFPCMLSMTGPQIKLIIDSIVNIEFVAKYTADLLSTSFPNMARPQVEACVAKMVSVQPEEGDPKSMPRDAAQQSQYSVFKQHLRDFLVLTKSFGDTAAGTYEEEDAAAAAAAAAQKQAIPGMVGPNELPDDGMADS